MADAEWRLRRVRAMIEAALTAKIEELPAGHPALRQAQAYEATRTNPIFKFEAKFERQYDRALKALLALKKAVVTSINRELDALENSLAQNATNEPNPTPLTPRNGPCPCGSREKYKRCCGKNAPPVLHAA